MMNSLQKATIFQSTWFLVESEYTRSILAMKVYFLLLMALLTSSLKVPSTTLQLPMG